MATQSTSHHPTQMALIYRWTRYHSFFVFALFILSIVQRSAVFVAVGGLLSFLYFILQHPKTETEQGILPFLIDPATFGMVYFETAGQVTKFDYADGRVSKKLLPFSSPGLDAVNSPPMAQAR